jgi:hypothetical protein
LKTPDREAEFVRILGFFIFPAALILELQGPEEAKNPAGEMSSA